MRPRCQAVAYSSWRLAVIVVVISALTLISAHAVVDATSRVGAPTFAAAFARQRSSVANPWRQQPPAVTQPLPPLPRNWRLTMSSIPLSDHNANDAPNHGGMEIDSIEDVVTVNANDAHLVVAEPTVTMASSTTSPIEPTAASIRTDTSSQASYGATLAFPSTFVRCGKCQTCFAITEPDLGGPRSKGRRLTCSVCDHTWFQSKDRLLEIRDGFEMQALPREELTRIALNIQEGKKPSFVGDMKLYVGNIAFESSEEELSSIFSTVGDVGEVSLVRDEVTGRIRGFGFVTMRTREEGQRAIDELNGVEVSGRNIAVRESTN